VSNAGSSDTAIGQHITVDEQVPESIDRQTVAGTMLPKSYAQTSLGRRLSVGVAAIRLHSATTDRVAGGAPTRRVDQGGPRDVAAETGRR
jgi:hypothetical protein